MIKCIQISIAAIAFISMIVIYMYISSMQKSMDDMRADIEAYRAEIAAADAQIEALRDNIARSEHAESIYIERVETGKADYERRIQETQNDPDACDWLDDVLPDSVRKRFSCDTMRANSGTDPPAGFTHAMQQADNK